MKSILTLIYC